MFKRHHDVFSLLQYVYSHMFKLIQPAPTSYHELYNRLARLDGDAAQCRVSIENLNIAQ
jgi:hypothetical protein